MKLMDSSKCCFSEYPKTSPVYRRYIAGISPVYRQYITDGHYVSVHLTTSVFTSYLHPITGLPHHPPGDGMTPGDASFIVPLGYRSKFVSQLPIIIMHGTVGPGRIVIYPNGTVTMGPISDQVYTGTSDNGWLPISVSYIGVPSY